MSAERILHWDPSSPSSLQLGSVVLSIGVFDGVHLGHRLLLDAAAADAAELGARLVTLTFDSDPDEVFHGSAGLDKLLSDKDRLELLAGTSSATVLSVPCSPAVMSMQPEAFLDALASVCAPKAFHVGVDFRFGAHAAGSVGTIEAWCAGHGCRCAPSVLLERGGAPVTATRIRALLAQGKVNEAMQLLGGRAHSIFGTVCHGRGTGAGMGFATANVDLAPDCPMLPAEGVYAAVAKVAGTSYAAAVNVGAAKSFKDAAAQVEAHLIGFSGDLYGKQVEVGFLEWLRPQRVFGDEAELIATVTANIDWAREHVDASRGVLR